MAVAHIYSMGFIALIIIGAAAGFIATRLMDIEADIITTVSVGVIGALVGGIMLRFLLTVASWLGGFIGAVLGAMLVIWAWQKFSKR